MNSDNEFSNSKLEWDYNVPMLTNKYVMKDFALSLGIPVLLVTLLIVILYYNDMKSGVLMEESDFSWIPKVLLVIFVLFSLTALIIYAVYGNKIETRFVMDSYGIKYYALESSRKKASALNFILLLFSLFKSSPGAASVATVSQITLSGKLRWKEIKKVKLYDRDLAILVKGGFGSKIMLYCTYDNFEEVKNLLNKNIQ